MSPGTPSKVAHRLFCTPTLWVTRAIPPPSDSGFYGPSISNIPRHPLPPLPTPVSRPRIYKEAWARHPTRSLPCPPSPERSPQTHPRWLSMAHFFFYVAKRNTQFSSTASLNSRYFFGHVTNGFFVLCQFRRVFPPSPAQRSSALWSLWSRPFRDLEFGHMQLLWDNLRPMSPLVNPPLLTAHLCGF